MSLLGEADFLLGHKRFEPDQKWLHQFGFAACRDPLLHSDNRCMQVTARPGFILFISPQIIVCLIFLGTQQVLKLIHCIYACHTRSTMPGNTGMES